MSAAVNKSAHKSCTGGISKLRCLAGSYEVSRVECEKLGYMAVTYFHLVIVHHPFLYLTVFADFGLRDLFQHTLQLCGKGLVSAQYFG